MRSSNFSAGHVMGEVTGSAVKSSDELSESNTEVFSTVEPATKPHPTLLERMGRRFLGLFRRVDQVSHGYVPFFCWLVLLFGGIWFPATPILQHVFEDEATPRGLLFGTSQHANPSNNEGDTIAERSLEHIEPLTASLLLFPCLLFWTWTNIALLCVMASAMGEVNRCAESSGVRPNFRAACTRAFFVYLFVLLNELAVAGSLTAGMEIQGTYARISILASLFCFVSSYRPSFYSGLITRFSTTQNGDESSPQSATPDVGTQGNAADVLNDIQDDAEGRRVMQQEHGQPVVG